MSFDTRQALFRWFTNLVNARRIRYRTFLPRLRDEQDFSNSSFFPL